MVLSIRFDGGMMRLRGALLAACLVFTAQPVEAQETVRVVAYTDTVPPRLAQPGVVCGKHLGEAAY